MRLLRAAASGDIQQARQAIDQGADIDCCDYNNHTPLHLACSRNHPAFKDFLISLGAKNNTKCIQESSGAPKPRARLPLLRRCRATEKTCDFHRCQSQSSTLATDAIKHSFPAPVADAMMRGLHVAAISKPSVSILFLDVVGFSELRGRMAPLAVVSLLERLFGALDSLAAQHGVERIDTIDGCYIAAANFSAHQPADHAVRLARFALAALAAAASTPIDTARPELGAAGLLAGMHCGAVCGRVVGAHGGCKHTLHGDAVNMASRMESHGVAGAVHCSAAAAALIEGQGGSGEGLRLTRRGEDVEVKSVGRMRTYWLSAGAGCSGGPAAAGGGRVGSCCRLVFINK